MIFNIFGHEIRIDERPEVIIETVETIKFVDKEQEYISFPLQESIVYASYSTVKDKVRSLDGFYKLGDIHIEDTSYKLVDVEHLKEWLKVDTTDILNYVPEYHDCLTGDTPVFVKINDTIKLVTVEELLEIDEDVYIFTDCGFVPMISISKKPELRETIKLLGNTCISMTPDHCIYSNGEYIESSDADISERLIIYPDIEQTFSGNYELGFAFGVFMAEGGAYMRDGYNGATWNIRMTDGDALERCMKAFNDYYKDMTFYIKEYESEKAGSVTNLGVRREGIKHLLVKPTVRNNDGSRGRFVEMFRDMFYGADKHKRIPSHIFAADYETKRGFIDGWLCGDGHMSTLTTVTELESIGYMSLCNSIGINTTCVPDGHGFYTVSHVRNGFTSTTKYSIVDNGYREVYDISTLTGRFVAGNIVVKNCDDMAVILHGHLNEWDSSLATAIAKVKKDGSTSRHMMNLVIGTDMKVYLIEPQNDNIFVNANGYQIRDVFFL
jgi:hypothetical protein